MTYQRDFAAVQDAIDEVTAIFAQQRTDAQQQLDALTGLNDTFEEYIGPILELQTNVLTAGFTQLSADQATWLEELRGLRTDLKRVVNAQLN